MPFMVHVGSCPLQIQAIFFNYAINATGLISHVFNLALVNTFFFIVFNLTVCDNKQFDLNKHSVMPWNQVALETINVSIIDFVDKH